MNVATPFNNLSKAICMGVKGGGGGVLGIPLLRESTVCFPQKPTKEVEKKHRLGVVGQINEQYLLKFELKIFSDTFGNYFGKTQ